MSFEDFEEIYVSLKMRRSDFFFFFFATKAPKEVVRTITRLSG